MSAAGQKQTLAILQQKVCFTPETDIPYTRLVAIERERRELKEGIALRPRSSSVTSDK